MNWSKDLLKKLEKEGKIKAVKIPSEPKKRVEIPKSIGKYKLHIISVLKTSGLKFVPEYKFSNDRNFRFDWALPDVKIAIEYEGIFSEKSGHTTIGGYTKDIEKYNLATKLGWKILRYTANNYLQIETDLKEVNDVFNLIKQKHDEFYNKDLKSYLYYAVALDEDENQVGEVFGYYSYCEDCKDEAGEDFNNILRKNRSDLDINCDNSDYKNVKEIIMRIETSPERDDFLNCEYCGELIDVGVLHAFTQEIECYLSDDENLNIKNLSNADCYRIHELINEHSDTELIEKLKEKILKENKLKWKTK